MVQGVIDVPGKRCHSAQDWLFCCGLWFADEAAQWPSGGPIAGPFLFDGILHAAFILDSAKSPLVACRNYHLCS